MRLGINTLFLIPGEVGGSETYLYGTLDALARAFPDIGLVLFTNVENDAALRPHFQKCGRAEFHRMPFRAANRVARILWEQTELPRAAGRAGVQVLWSPGYTAPLRAPCPQVVTLLDMQYKRYPEDLSAVARVATELLVQQAARRCQRILTLSEFSKQEILRFTRAVPERIVVTPLAADPVFAERPPEEEDGTRLRRLLPSGAPYVLCVANTYPHKNVHALVEAFGQLPARFPQRLVLVGKPRRGEGAVRRALRALPAGRQVVRVAGLAAEDLAALYRRADLFLFPSLYEGFGLPVLEAMAAGTPVIAARAAAVPEVGGDAVCYFDGSAAELCTRIEHLLTLSDAERRAIAAAGQRQAAGFSWERTAARTVEVLQASLSA